MLDKRVVQESLRRICEMDLIPGRTPGNKESNQDNLTSLLIHDIFGGEILKTRKKSGWHFYNRVDGERLDFTSSEICNLPAEICFEDLPSSPEETCNSFEKEDYSTFFMRFVFVFEETIGLTRNRPGFII